MDKHDMRTEEPGKRFLGCGRAALYRDALRPGETLLEEGRFVYAAAADFFCTGCEGAGCTFCKFDGRRSAQRQVSEKKRARAASRESRKETSTECSKHPRQPVVTDARGVKRFKQNAIVRELLDRATAAGIMDMNAIALMNFSDEDQQQFAQLIGYSVSGYSGLSYAGEQDGCRCDVHKAVRAARAR